MCVDEKEQLREIRETVFFQATYDHEDDDDWVDEHPVAGASYNPSDVLMLDEVLRGERTLDPSHHGGEFRELLDNMANELSPKRCAAILSPLFL
jgi:hypothetical protein